MQHGEQEQLMHAVTDERQIEIISQMAEHRGNALEPLVDGAGVGGSLHELARANEGRTYCYSI